MSRRPGGSRQRRIRLAIHRPANSNLVVVHINDRRAPIPVNWCEDLARHFVDNCRRPDEILNRRPGSPPLHLTVPRIDLNHEATPLGPFVVWIPKEMSTTDAIHYRILDKTVEWWDVWYWPKASAKAVRRSNQVYLRTNLLKDADHPANQNHPDFVQGARSSALIPKRLSVVNGINWRHISPFDATWKGYVTLGLRTNCPKDSTCRCRNLLEAHWALSWEV